MTFFRMIELGDTWSMQLWQPNSAFCTTMTQLAKSARLAEEKLRRPFWPGGFCAPERVHPIVNEEKPLAR